MRRGSLLVLLAAAVLIGLLIAWIDSRPNWDDTGITAGMILLATAVFGALVPQRAWLFALAVGVWIPLAGIIQQHNYGSIPVLGIAFIGASLLVRWITKPSDV